jgi:hypothetical protein
LESDKWDGLLGFLLGLLERFGAILFGDAEFVEEFPQGELVAFKTDTGVVPSTDH